MKPTMLILLTNLLLTGCRKTATETANTMTGQEQQSADVEETGAYCRYRKTARKPATTFPFSMADKIEVVSFKSGKMTLTNSQFEIRALQERFRLNRIQTDSLFSILYNYGYREPESSQMVADCYGPQHAILFYRRSRAIAFLEICFVCGNKRASGNVDFGEFCQGKVTMMNTFVKQIGIRYGLPEHAIPY